MSTYDYERGRAVSEIKEIKEIKLVGGPADGEMREVEDYPSRYTISHRGDGEPYVTISTYYPSETGVFRFCGSERLYIPEEVERAARPRGRSVGMPPDARIWFRARGPAFIVPVASRSRWAAIYGIGFGVGFGIAAHFLAHQTGWEAVGHGLRHGGIAFAAGVVGLWVGNEVHKMRVSK